MDFPEHSFPLNVCQHSGEPGWLKRGFAEYGSFSQIDCHCLSSGNDVNPVEMKCRPQKGMGVIKGLGGNLPCLPIFDHSLSESKLIQDNILGGDHYEDAVKSAKFVIDFLPKTVNQRKKQFFEIVDKVRVHIDHCLAKSAKSKHWNALNKNVPTDLKDLTRKYSSVAKASNLNCMMGFNRDFCQGLLCHKQSSDSPLLFHAAGDGFKDIYMTEVSATEECIPRGNHIFKLALDEPIFQLNCSDGGLLCARQENKCTVMTFDESKSCISEPKKTISFGKKLSGIEFSPYNKNELLTSSASGHVYLSNLDSGSQISFQKVPKSECSIPWSSCHFAGHPRQIVVSDCFSMDMFDHRENFSKGLELFHLSSMLVKNNERLMVTTSIGFPYHLVATDFSLFAVDQRFPGSPVLQWNTENINTPQYLKSCKLSQVGGGVGGGDNEHFIFLGSQQPAEVICYPLNLTQGCAPVTNTLPWSVGKIGDFVSHENTTYQPQWISIEKHFQSSLAGLSVVDLSSKGKHVISVYQMDGYGDIYFQDFKFSPESGDPGCYTLELPSDEKKAAANCRAIDFLSFVDKTQVLDRSSELSDNNKASFAFSSVKSIMKETCKPSVSKEHSTMKGGSSSNFYKSCFNHNTKLVGMESLSKEGPNTKLLLALKKKEDIHHVLMAREKDYEAKKELLRQKYLLGKGKAKAKRQKAAVKKE